MNSRSLVALCLISIACKKTEAPAEDAAVAPAASASPSASAEPVATTTVTDAVVISPDIAKSNNAFASDLYGKLRTEKGDLFFSPLSISLALAMAYGGARGDTAKAMGAVMHLPSLPDVHAAYGTLVTGLSSAAPGPIVRIANRMYADKTVTLDPGFVAMTRNAYHAPIDQMDFVTAGEPARISINDWVSHETEGKIHDLLPTIDKKTRLIIVNAIYFKASWEEPFLVDDTKPEPFYGAAGEKPRPMMHQTKYLKYAENAKLQVVERAYKDPTAKRTLAMDIILPRARADLAAAEDVVKSGMDALLGALKGHQVELTMPKMDLELSFDLGKPLGDLGIGIAFEDRADFSGIGQPKPPEHLRISKALHKTFLKVDETGTEAAAATALSMGAGGGAPPKPIVLKADHPFVFLIRDTASGAILFLGRLT